RRQFQVHEHGRVFELITQLLFVSPASKTLAVVIPFGTVDPMGQIKKSAQDSPITVDYDTISIAEISLRWAKNEMKLVFDCGALLSDQVVGPKLLHGLAAPTHINPVDIIRKEITIIV